MTDEELKQLVAANARSIQAMADQAARERQEAARERQETTRERQELRQLIEANARSIQAMADQAAEDRKVFRDAILRLTRVQEGIANLLASLDDDRPTILRRLMAIENKVDKLLENRE